ncbi:MAG TPA: metallophosphoesterase, partial [Longimicrobium sp.]|nr:metallophosphoesterase [Longimicrobium sp.]
AVLVGTVVAVVDLGRLVAWAVNRVRARVVPEPVPAPAPLAMAGVAGSGGESAPEPRAPEAANGSGPESPERRLFLARVAAGGAVVAGGGLSAFGVWRAYAEPVVTELSVVVPRLPRTLDGMSIVQVSDVHVSTLIQRRFMDEMVRRCNALKPDLMAITGDLVDGSVEALGHHASALSNLRTRFGSFFVTGNHEYYSGDVEWSAALEGMGVTVLRNRHVTVGDAGGKLDIVGVDDWTGRGGERPYDFDKAVEGRNRDHAAVLLAHQPRDFEKAVEHGIGLQLSGHTHGGQLFPGTLFIPMLWPRPAGHFTLGDGHLYVSRGTGFWGPPMRVGAPPEIVKIVLRSA